LMSPLMLSTSYASNKRRWSSASLSLELTLLSAALVATFPCGPSNPIPSGCVLSYSSPSLHSPSYSREQGMICTSPIQSHRNLEENSSARVGPASTTKQRILSVFTPSPGNDQLKWKTPHAPRAGRGQARPLNSGEGIDFAAGGQRSVSEVRQGWGEVLGGLNRVCWYFRYSFALTIDSAAVDRKGGSRRADRQAGRRGRCRFSPRVGPGSKVEEEQCEP
jgi:hypothetical protein